MGKGYETLPLKHVFEMLESNKGDIKTLRSIAEKAYKVACEFSKIINRTFVSKYLNNQLSIDALCDLSLKACLLSQEANGGMYSISHTHWLNEVRKTKLIWDRKSTNQIESLDTLMQHYQILQDLSFSYVTKQFHVICGNLHVRNV
jgi:hypothetical protein